MQENILEVLSRELTLLKEEVARNYEQQRKD